MSKNAGRHINGDVIGSNGEDKAYRIYSGSALHTPDHWAHKQYRLTMTMLDTLTAKKTIRTYCQ